MSKRLSELYGMEIYTLKAQHVGRVEDVILNLEEGEVMRLSLRTFRGARLPSDEVRRILTEDSISYDDVVEVGDIILVEKQPVMSKKQT